MDETKDEVLNSRACVPTQRVAMPQMQHQQPALKAQLATLPAADPVVSLREPPEVAISSWRTEITSILNLEQSSRLPMVRGAWSSDRVSSL